MNQRESSNSDLERATKVSGELWRYVRGETLTRSACRDLCRELGCSRSTLFRHLATLREKQVATALIPKKRGRKPLSRFLSEAHEEVIVFCVERFFLTREQLAFDELARRVHVEFQKRGLSPVFRKALKARLNTIEPRKLVKKREGASVAREQFEMIHAHYSVGRPLAVMQIDHTVLDAMAIAPETGKVLGRPTLTFCIDVYSRVICGFLIGFERPSAKVLMRVFSQAVRPKSELLEALRVQSTWPVFGIPEAVHSDNGSDLTSNAFTTGLANFGINHFRRPLRRPNWGGHVERYIRTNNSLVHSIPGTTRSNVKERGPLDPKKQACLSLDDLRRLVVSYICDVYHKTDHSSLGEPPLRRWQRYWEQIGEQPRLPTDIVAFDRHFLPFETRKIREYGLRFKHLYYRSPALQKMRDCGVRSVRFKYDPDDVRQLYVEGNYGAFETVPCERRFHRRISFAEHALLRDRADTNTNRWSDADLLRHYQLRDDIVSKAKRRKRDHQKVDEAIRVSSRGALRPDALNFMGSKGARP